MLSQTKIGKNLQLLNGQRPCLEFLIIRSFKFNLIKVCNNKFYFYHTSFNLFNLIVHYCAIS